MKLYHSRSNTSTEVNFYFYDFYHKLLFLNFNLIYTIILLFLILKINFQERQEGLKLYEAYQAKNGETQITQMTQIIENAQMNENTRMVNEYKCMLDSSWYELLHIEMRFYINGTYIYTYINIC